MLDEFSIEIEGLEEACGMLTEAPGQVVPGALLHGLTAAGDVIEEYIAGRTPDKTGEMLVDLGYTVTLDANFRGGEVAVGFGDQGYKAAWVEYGHRMIGHKPGKKDEGMVQPHPFMRPAAEAATEPALDAFEDAVMGDLQQAEILDAA